MRMRNWVGKWSSHRQTQLFNKEKKELATTSEVNPFRTEIQELYGGTPTLHTDMERQEDRLRKSQISFYFLLAEIDDNDKNENDSYAPKLLNKKIKFNEKNSLGSRYT